MFNLLCCIQARRSESELIRSYDIATYACDDIRDTDKCVKSTDFFEFHF